MTELTTTDMSLDEAREFIAYVRNQQRELPRRIQDAWRRRAWVALGFPSWDAMCIGERIQLRGLPRDERQEIVVELRAAGMSTRAIGSALGVHNTTVGDDLASAGNPADQPETVTSLDGRERPASRPIAPPAAFEPRDETEPEPDPLPPPIADEIEQRIAERTTPRREPVMLSLRTHAGGEVPYPKPQSKPTFNETTGEGISWAAWSWNPVTGCLHGCDYCYARAIIHRYPDANPAGFTPLFHEERLDAPGNTTVPAAHGDDPAYRRVFVCSMADLYGRWVPMDWIDRVHDSMLQHQQWEYLLLTKFPDRYIECKLPPTAWVGTSVDEQKRVRIAERAFRRIEGVKVKWLSLEPLREPLEFDDLSMFDWVVIGAQTATVQPDGAVPAFAPHYDWVQRITEQARAAGCRVHHKPNLVNGRPGMQMLNEYPLDGGA